MASKREQEAKTIQELIEDQNRLLREQTRIIKEQAGASSDLLSDQQDISNVIKDQISLLKFQRTEKSLLRKVTNDINKIAQETFSIGKRQLGIDKTDLDFAKKRIDLERKIRVLKQQQQKFAKDTDPLNNAIAESIAMQVDEATKLALQIDHIANSSARIKDNFGVKTFGNLTSAIKSVPGISAFSGPFDEAAKASLEMSQDIEHALKTGEGLTKKMVKNLGLGDKLKSKAGDTLAGTAGAKKFDKLGAPEGKKLLGVIDRKGLMAFKAGIVSLGKSLVKALGPAVMIAEFLKALISSDKAAGDLAKSMNMTYSDALRTRSELREMAQDQFLIGSLSEQNAVTTKGLQESLVSINQSLGTNVMASEEMLVEFTQLREMAGFTNEELQGIANISLATGKSMEDITGEFMAQAKISAMQNGVLLNEKQLAKDIGKISAATTLSLGKNPKLIGEAVATAKSLGMELSKVEAIAGQLLDFESSIENELQAELLLGRDINLEKARQAALNNDLATVAKEIANQAGSAAEFTEMNVIQQEALAKSVGMTREDLAATLLAQEQLRGLTGDAAKEADEAFQKRVAAVGIAQAQRELEEGGIENLKNQQSQAERLSNTISKIQEIFVAMAEPILAVGNALMPIVEIAGFIVTGMMKVSTAVGNAIGTLKELGVVGKIVGGIAAVLASMLAYSALAPIPIVGPVLGFAAAAAVMTAFFKATSDSKKAGDMFSSKGKTMVSPAEGGLFELSPNDEFAAAPKLGQMLGGNQNQTTFQQDTSKMERLLAEVVAGQKEQIKKTPEMAPLGLYEVQ